MGGGVAEGLDLLDETEDELFQSEESDYAWNDENCTQLRSQEVVVPRELEYHGNSSRRMLRDILQGKDVDLSLHSVEGFDCPCASHHSVDVSSMFEELTLGNNGSLDLGNGSKAIYVAVPSSSGNPPAAHQIARTANGASLPDNEGFSLRWWLDNGNAEVNKVDRVNIFRQILDLVNISHSNGIVLLELRPSSFKLLPSNRVEYLGPSKRRELLESVEDRSIISNSSAFSVAKAASNIGTSKREYDAPSKAYGSSNRYRATAHAQHSAIIGSQLEKKWYQSPEELRGGGCSISSNIYCLGVLLFELLGQFDSITARNAAMMDLRHRILPPRFLSENPKEAGFCLWLLHPDPGSRPFSRKIIESEALSGVEDVNTEEAALTSSVEQECAESELLLDFLNRIKEHNQKEAAKLVDNINCIEADIAEIERRHSATKPSLHPYLLTNSSDKKSTSSNVKETRWSGNISQLENAYFSMRSTIQLTQMDASRTLDDGLLTNHENRQQQCTPDRKGAFFDGLCKYARYSKFQVRGILRNGEFTDSSARMICSLSFSGDEDYFASAGVSKKIRVFEFQGLLNESVDIHYPVIEMLNGSKLSCICWNNYIRNYLASTDYDGTVKLWDASTGQGFSEYSEHEKRAWSVDFSRACPTKFASGSDDCSVKLWSINERNCLDTIRSKANVCCVQFSPHSAHLLAFGSADHKTYCYDLRNINSPWCILSGHKKAISYVKFLDSDTIVTASTDNSLKIWDLNKTSPSGLSKNACSWTLSGHTNEKNFVGFSVADGYIACGSETNEVFSYYKSLPMPITSHEFGSIDPVSGECTDDDNGHFISSVCWKGNSDMLVAANSSGSIKVLQLA